jgi:predicted metal-dependent hydrolase
MKPSQITVIRSTRRKKTIQTKYANGHLWVYLPAGMNPKDEEKWITKMIQRSESWEQKKSAKHGDIWLQHRAQYLNKKYFNESLEFSIWFVTNQNSRYGSCTTLDKTIRISHRVQSMPLWVQDYIILHELTHLLYPNHSKEFWAKVDQYQYAERAKGYLIALGADPEIEQPNSTEFETTHEER